MTVYITEGSGPPLVLIAQLGCGGDVWQPVVDRLEGLQVITYDRPGTGTAVPRPAPNPPLSHSGFARELADLLDQHGVTEPAVIVGHSFGALIARAYTAAHPRRVSGLVIVDGSLPQFHIMPSNLPKLDGDHPDSTEIDVVLGQIEILRAPVPQVPSLVITRAHGTWDGINPPPRPAIEDLWEIVQRQLAAQYGTHLIVADTGGHQLQRETPDLVAYAIKMVRQAAVTEQTITLDPATLAKIGGHLAD